MKITRSLKNAAVTYKQNGRISLETVQNLLYDYKELASSNEKCKINPNLNRSNLYKSCADLVQSIIRNKQLGLGGIHAKRLMQCCTNSKRPNIKKIIESNIK